MRIKVGLWFLLTLPRPGVDLNYHMRTLKTHFFFISITISKYPYLTLPRRIDETPPIQCTQVKLFIETTRFNCGRGG